MNAGTTSLSCAAERLPRWSSTGHDRARPDRRLVPLPALLSSQKTIVLGARAEPIGLTSRRNLPTAARQRLTLTSITAVKSP
jgi:hypothetical protein